MFDTLSHCAMALITLALLLVLANHLSIPMTLSIATAWSMLLREQTQRSPNFFPGGWDFHNWSIQKLLETFVPVILILMIGASI